MRRTRTGLSDPFPRLPPGCTPSDIDKAFGERRCKFCSRPELEGHAPGCPASEDCCDVCNPPPDRYRDADPTFCEQHTEKDLQRKLEAEADAASGHSSVIVPQNDREDTE